MASSRSGRHGGSPQSWPCWLNASGGAPTCTPMREDVLQRPAVGALRVAADGEVVHDPHPGRPGRAVHARQLPLHLLLQPGVEGDPRGQLAAGAATSGAAGCRSASGHRLQRPP